MTGNQQTLEVMSPQADIDVRKVRPAPRVAQLDDKKVGLASNRKPGANWALDRVAQLLGERYKNVKFEMFEYTQRPFPPEAYERMAAAGCDAFVGASAD